MNSGEKFPGHDIRTKEGISFLVCPMKSAANCLFFLLAVVFMAGCATKNQLPNAPNIYQAAGYSDMDIPAVWRSVNAEIFYMTDRRAEMTEDGPHYVAQRDDSMVFGASRIAFGNDLDWDELRDYSSRRMSSRRVHVNLLSNREIVRFDPTPLPFEVENGVPRIKPVALASYREKSRKFQQQVTSQLRRSGTDEVLILVHGFNNSFEDGITSLANVWHYSGRHAMPILYSWPAGRGGPFGYFTDRESGEFTIFHLKDFLTQLSQVPQVRKIHIIAHSRGADVTTTALREMIIAVRTRGERLQHILKIENLILAAPDLDFSIVRQRLIAEQFGLAIAQVTVYVNRSDSALALSERLSSGNRFGTLGSTDLQDVDRVILGQVKNVNFVNVDKVRDPLGHGYYRSDPAVLSDISSLIRTGAPPGSPERPLIPVDVGFWRLPENYPL